jgi:hypothetical protein
MKKFFIILGSIFLVVIVLGAIGIAFVAVRGNALDKEEGLTIQCIQPLADLLPRFTL